MDISEAGLQLIISFESFSPVCYNDPAGNATIGVGELLHLGPCTQDDMNLPPMTEAEGLARLRLKVREYADAVEAAVTVPLQQHQFDALCDAAYNLGVGGVRGIIATVNAGGDVCAELRRYVRGSDGVVYPGLVRRRAAECALYGGNGVEDEGMNDEVKAAIGELLKEQGALGARLDELTNDLRNIAGLAARLQARLDKAGIA